MDEYIIYDSQKRGEQVEGSVSVFNISPSTSADRIRSTLSAGKYPITIMPSQSIHTLYALNKSMIGLENVLNNGTTISSTGVNLQSSLREWPTAKTVYEFFKYNRLQFNLLHLKVSVLVASFMNPQFKLIPCKGYELPFTITIKDNNCSYDYDNTTGILKCYLPLTNYVESGESAIGTVIATGDPTDWWNDVSAITEEKIGQTNIVYINGVEYRARLIGVDHDNLSDQYNKAHTTWQLIPPIPQESGESGDVWDETNNYDYAKSSVYVSSIAEIFDNLPTGLKRVMLSAKKNYIKAGNKWNTISIESQDSKLTLPSKSEMLSSSSYLDAPRGIDWSEEGYQYKYYEWNPGTSDTKLDKEYWLRTPHIKTDDEAAYIDNTGALNNKNIMENAPVSPIFFLGKGSECYPISGNIVNGSLVGESLVVKDGGTTVYIKPNHEYATPLSLTISGADYTYNRATGAVILTNASGYVTIAGECKRWWDDDVIKEMRESGDETLHLTDNGDIGAIREISINGWWHRVRLIGIDHDTIIETDENGVVTDSTSKAHTTWEFVDLICDENGYSYGCVWADESGYEDTNMDYLNSTIRNALKSNWTDSDVINYTHRGESGWSQFTKGTGNNIWEQLPESFRNKIMTVQKSVGVGSNYTETGYSDKLFMLSAQEMGYTSQYDKGYGTTYKYYALDRSEKTEISRIKTQVNNLHTYSQPTIIESGEGQIYPNKVYNYAGFNAGNGDLNGGICWLRSPSSYWSNAAWICNDGGSIDVNFYNVSNLALGIAPAFCLGKKS